MASIVRPAPTVRAHLRRGLAAACAAVFGLLAATADAATISTDKMDYLPGEKVVISGSGFQPGETVYLFLHEIPTTHDDVMLTAVADANGDISNMEFTPEQHDTGVTFTLGAVGGESGLYAETVFTDPPATCTSNSQCSDNNPCTTDTCFKPVSFLPGVCLNTAKCNDLDPCTTDLCDATTGACSVAPKNCGDGRKCTLDICVPFIGLCLNTDKVCVDFNECTTGYCEEDDGGCYQRPKPKGHACLPDLDFCSKDECDGYGKCAHPRKFNGGTPGNANQKGTLLMFPKIVVDTAKGVDTLVDITNAGDRDVTVTCYWVDGATWEKPDFHFPLTKRQPSYFRASDGLPGPFGGGVRPFPSDPGKGELKCWASDDFGFPIKHNYLKGEAVVTDATNASAWEYAATGFQCRLAGKFLDHLFKDGELCDSSLLDRHLRHDPAGKIHLDGCEFDACPSTLELDFFSSNDKSGQSKPLGGTIDTDIALVPCDQDLRQEGEPVTTKEKYEIWNENETKFTGLTRCLTCFDHAKLSAIGGAFKRSVLHTEKGLARIDGVSDDAKCCPKEFDENGNLRATKCSRATALVGVQVKEINRTGRLDRAGDPILGAGAQAGEICFDPNDRSEEGR
jgi:hypothetical protein